MLLGSTEVHRLASPPSRYPPVRRGGERQVMTQVDTDLYIALGRLSPATEDVAVFTPIRPESDARVI
jgi:hypothetical protein